MNGRVGSQVLSFPERPAAQVAEELLLPRVHLHVLLQAESASTLAAADRALVVLVALVFAFVHGKLGLRAETLVAVLTLVTLVGGVDTLKHTAGHAETT